MKQTTIALCLSFFSCAPVADAKPSGIHSRTQQHPKTAKQLPDLSDQKIQDKVKALHLPFNQDSTRDAETYLCEELSKVGQNALADKDYDFARQVFAKYLKVRPKEAGAQFGLGLSFLGQKRYQEARQEFEKLAKNQQKGDLFLASIDALIREKRYADAVAAVNALDVYGRDFFFHIAKSRILAAQGKMQEAVAEGQLALRIVRMNNYADKTAVQQLESLGGKAVAPEKKTADALFPKILGIFDEIGKLKEKPSIDQLRLLIQQKLGTSAEITIHPASSFTGDYSKTVLFCLSDNKPQQYPILSMNTSALVEPMPINLLVAHASDYKSHFANNHSNSKNASARLGNLVITWTEHEGKVSAGYLSCYWKEKPPVFPGFAKTTSQGVTKPPPAPDPDALLKEGEEALNVRKFDLAKKKFVSVLTNWNGKHGQIQLEANKHSADRIRKDFRTLYEMQDDIERARYFELASLHQIQDDSFAVESLPGKNYPTAAELSARNWQLISDDDCVQIINENYFNITIVNDSPFFKEVLNLVGKHPRFSTVDIKPLPGSLIDRIEASEFSPPTLQ